MQARRRERRPPSRARPSQGGAEARPWVAGLPSKGPTAAGLRPLRSRLSPWPQLGAGACGGDVSATAPRRRAAFGGLVSAAAERAPLPFRRRHPRSSQTLRTLRVK